MTHPKTKALIATLGLALGSGHALAQVLPGETGELVQPEPMGGGEKGVTPSQPPAPPVVPAEQRVPRDMQLRGEALQLVRAAARSDRPSFRAQAIEALQLGAGRDADATILRGLRDEEPIVRFAAAMAVGALDLRSAYPDPLLRLANPREDAQVRVGAIYATTVLGDTRLTDELAALTRHTSETVRGSAVLALGLTDAPSAIEVLNGRRGDPSPAVRLQTYEALWRLGDVEARDSLISGMFSLYPDEELFCTLALAANGDRRVIVHIRPKLTSEYSYIALAASRAMGQLGSDEGYGVALQGAKSEDPQDRSLAAFAFGDIGRLDAQPYLGQLMTDADPNVRLAAASAVLKLTQ
ncbi:MAG: HEAT repeat domain-containing protein [Planctomycetota bacterium]